MEQSRSDCYSVTIILLATLFGDNISYGVDKICLSLLTGDSFSVIIHIEYTVGTLLLFQTRMQSAFKTSIIPAAVVFG